MGQQKVSADEKRGVAVVTVDYDLEEMFQKGASEELRSAILGAYDRLVEEKKAIASLKKLCVVVIEAKTVGSPLLRALFELYKKIAAEGGEVRVAGFPPDYKEVLNALGMSALRGFSLSRSEDEALKELAPPAAPT